MSKHKKAGVIPYILEEGVVKMLFMEAADAPNVGWQIAKGKADKDENKRETALREAAEELGLFEPNCKSIDSLGSFGGLSLFIAEITDVEMFGDPDRSEVSQTQWLTMEEFTESGRKIQKHIVKQAYNIILEKLMIKEVI